MSMDPRFEEMLARRMASTAVVLDAVRNDAELMSTTVRAAVETAGSINNGGTLFICGNGGSAAEATHLSGELVGPFANRQRRPLPAIALGFDTSAATAVSNDFSFAEVFSRQLTALSRPGDVLWALSTSGGSPNVLMALEAARRLELRSVLLTGNRPSAGAGLADITLAIPSAETPRIQELHLVLGHFMCELIEELAG